MDNTDDLCKECQEFDYIMNRKDGCSFDVLVVCNHKKEQEQEKMKESDNV